MSESAKVGAWRDAPLTRENAVALAKSIAQGKPTKDCPIPFSYVNASQWFTEYVLSGEGSRDVPQLTKQLTVVQEKSTALVMEVRELRGSLVLDGWWCPCAKTEPSETTAGSRGIFNGSGRELRTHCRCCGAPRPT